MTRFVLHGHYLSGPTYKVALMLSLAGAEWDFRLVDLRSGMHKAPEFLELNRFGQVPALEDGDLKLCQSAAILEHLAEKLGRFRGTNEAERAQAREWLFWSFDVLTPGVYRTVGAVRGLFKADESVQAYFLGLAERGFSTLEDWLDGRDWLVGSEPTIADVDVAAVLASAKFGNLDLADRPTLQAYLESVRGLPGYLSLEAFRDMAVPAAA